MELILFSLLLAGGLALAVEGSDDSDDSDDDAAPPPAGTPGNDSLTASGADLVNGAAGDDTIHATDTAVGRGAEGFDHLTAEGQATILGGYDRDYLEAAGQSSASGGAGSDILWLQDEATGWGDNGGDTLAASGAATAFGGEGLDRLNIRDEATGSGDAGDDSLVVNDDATGYGGAGEDSLVVIGGSGYGDAGNDMLETSYAGTNLFGGDGDDSLSSWSGTRLTGGAGSDSFEVDPQWRLPPFNPETAITDFTPDEDSLTLHVDGLTDITLDEEDGDSLIRLTGTGYDAEGTAQVVTTIVRLEGVTGLVLDDFDVTGLFPEVGMTAEITGDGDDAVTLHASDPTYLITQGGNDIVTAERGGTHQILTGDGDDSVASDGSGRIDTGDGDDRVALDLAGRSSQGTGPSEAVVWGGEGDDTITAEGRGEVVAAGGDGDDSITFGPGIVDGAVHAGPGADTVSVWSGVNVSSYDDGQDAVDQITVHVDAHRAAATEAGMIRMDPDDPDDRLVVEIDARLAGDVSFVQVEEMDYLDRLIIHTSLQVDGVEVLKLDGTAAAWQTDPRLTILRDVAFA